MRRGSAERNGPDAVVETVCQITEALIWGEEHDSRFFDFFCEKNILADLVDVLGREHVPKNVKVQLLQTLSMLVSNFRSKTSVYYLLSNNHINRLFSAKLDFDDEDILAYYVSFTKSLAMRLDQESFAASAAPRALGRCNGRGGAWSRHGSVLGLGRRARPWSPRSPLR